MVKMTVDYKITKLGKLASLSNEFKNETAEQESTEERTNLSVNSLQIWACALSPDESRLAWSYASGFLKILNCHVEQTDETDRRWAKVIEIEAGSTVCSLSFGSSKRDHDHRSAKRSNTTTYKLLDFNRQHTLILAAGLSNGNIRIYDALTGQFLVYLLDHGDLVRDLKFSKDASLMLASTSDDSTIKLWNMHDDGNMFKTLVAHSAPVFACDWSPKCNLLVSAGANRQAFIWNMQSFEVQHTLKGHLNDVSTCGFAPDGSVVATGSYDTRICLWNSFTGQLIRQFFHLNPCPGIIYAGSQNEHYVRSLSFDRSNNLISMCDDGKLRIWSLESSGDCKYEQDHKHGSTMCYSTRSRILFVGNNNGYLYKYQIQVPIPKLTILCRNLINSHLVDTHRSIDNLNLPNKLKQLLKYHR